MPSMLSRARSAFKLAALLAVALLASACQMTVYSDLSQQDANVMVATLIRNGVPASRTALEGGKFAVEVDEADMPRAVEILEREGLPRQAFANLGEVFAREGLLSSPTEERARLVYATSQELSATISQIDGVLSARIHVVLPEEQRAGRSQGGGSASVFIRHKPEVDMAALTPHVKLLVTNSIANLAYDEVSVITVAAQDASADAAPAFERAAGLWVVREDAGRARILVFGLAGLALIALMGHLAWVWAWANGKLPARRSSAARARVSGLEGEREVA